MDPTIVAAYVRQALELAGYTLAPAEVDAVVAEFGRIAAIADLFANEDLPLELEPITLFRP